MKTDNVLKIAFIIIMAFIAGFICMFKLATVGGRIYNVSKEKTIVSYEYTLPCRCGGAIEGYESLVDGYVREECKSCGYHAEFNTEK